MRCILLIIFCITCLLSYSQDSKLAENYMDQGEYNKALSVYKKIYEQNRSNPRTIYN